MEKEMKKNRKKITDTSAVKKLSKIGEWLKSGPPIDAIVDIRAVLR